MSRALFFFLKIAVLVAAAVWLANQPGRVVIEWGDWRLDTSPGLLVAAALGLAVGLALLYRFWWALRRMPGRIAENRRLSRHYRGYKALSQGLVAVAAGDAAEARRSARRAESLLDDPPLTRLLAAQAAQLEGDEQAAQRYFETMLERDETAFLGVRGLLTQALRRDDQPRALDLARRAYRLRPDSDWVPRELFRLLAAAGEWTEADTVLQDAIRRKAVAKEEGRRSRAALLVEQARAAAAGGAPDIAVSRAREAVKLDPDLVAAAVELARLQQRQGDGKRAIRTLEDAWKRAPHPDLAQAYAHLVPAESALDRARRVKRLLALRPGALEGHMAVATAALDADLWGEARAHLGSAMTHEEGTTQRSCRTMAALEEAEHGDVKAARAWFERASTARPDPAWTCRECGTVAPEWHACCGQCGAFNTMEWRTPPHVAALPAMAPDASASLPGGAAPRSAAPEPPRLAPDPSSRNGNGPA
ncbi:MAG: heme biosynthesis protein HemY [Alphaproteobacteria bacterium]